MNSLFDAAAEDADGRMRQRKCLFIIRTFFVYLSLVKPQKTSYITTNIHTKSVIIFSGKSSGVKKLLSSVWYGLGGARRGVESGVKINVAITPESRISSNIFLVT